MNKQNKILLRAFKIELKLAEIEEKIERKRCGGRLSPGKSKRPMGDLEYGCASVRRPLSSYFAPTYKEDNFDGLLKSVLMHKGNGEPENSGCEYVGSFTARLLKSNSEKIKSLEKELEAARKAIVADRKEIEEKTRELFLYKEADRHRLNDEFARQCEDRLNRKSSAGVGFTKFFFFDGRLMEEATLSFAGEDLAHVNKLLSGLSAEYRATLKFVHCKSAELTTETLVVLSPEGETILRITKDKSNKYTVR